jgi:hypothetical protein
MRRSADSWSNARVGRGGGRAIPKWIVSVVTSATGRRREAFRLTSKVGAKRGADAGQER